MVDTKIIGPGGPIEEPPEPESEIGERDDEVADLEVEDLEEFPGEPTPQAARRVAWLLLLLPAAAQFILHYLTNGRYGIFRDEYYYLACADRLALGYVDQPALSIWILAAWKSLFGDSLQSIRILPALCGSGLIFLTGALAAQMGGRAWAQLFAGLAVAIGAAGLVIGGFYSMNAFDLIFWTGAYFLLVRLARTGDGRMWIWLGLWLGLGLMNKIGILVFGIALVPGLILTAHRRHFLDKRLWIAGGIAAAFLIPYFLWNVANDWAGVEFIQNAKRYKISAISPLDFLTENVLMANPLTVLIWFAGLLWLLLARRARAFRIVALMFLATYAILILQKSKAYYFAASFPVLMAAGGVAWEGWTKRPQLFWARWILAVILLIGGVLFAPMAVPLLPPRDLVAYQQRLGIVPKAAEVGHDAAIPQYFSDRFGWERFVRTTAKAFESLSAEEKAKCVIVAGNYGQAGALEYWSRAYDLPPVYCRHNSYWLWGPPPGDGEVVIAINFDRDDLADLFFQVTEAGVAVTPEAEEDEIRVWICRGLRPSFHELWGQLKMFI